eukprot:scaffold3956_cov99-Cylindrotheca_fusiformis.AAC.2
MASSIRKRPDMFMAAIVSTGLVESVVDRNDVAMCESPPERIFESGRLDQATQPSWFRREVLTRVGIALPANRVLTPQDPALKLSKRCIKRRQRDEARVLDLLNKAPTLGGDPEKIKRLGDEIFEVTYGKGVTPQIREDFLLKYGCTGWTDEVLKEIVQLCDKGLVEIGAGHGQWSRALSETYLKQFGGGKKPGKRFDYVLAYDDMSELPLNLHIYNQYTQPHHDYFGNVKKLESKTDITKVLRSWACRGRALLLVYPSPGDMAVTVAHEYVNAARENDTIIYVGEGRGGANGNDSFFDFLENGNWVLYKVMEVQTPPGDKGYEKLFILKRRH